jgi:DNA polymerase-3 subunit delta
MGLWALFRGTMPIYFYWGEDEFALNRAVTTLRDRTLDPDWASFNFDKFTPEQPEAFIQAMNQAMTPPFGMGKRFIWLVETTICQKCPESLLAELERTLPAIPDTSVLLLTSSTKPDGRLKSTKLLQKQAEVREFSPIAPWKTDQLIKQVQTLAKDVGVKLTSDAVAMLADSIGNDTRHLYTELEKLRTYAGEGDRTLGEQDIADLVLNYTQSSLKLAEAIRLGKTPEALTLVDEMLGRNDSAIAITLSLVKQFRTWLWVKLMLESGERNDQAIAKAAEVVNPKQIYYLQQAVKRASLQSLQRSLSLLLELEVGLKQGAEARLWMQTKVVQLCQLYV